MNDDDEISNEDRALFRQAVGKIHPVKSTKRSSGHHIPHRHAPQYIEQPPRTSLAAGSPCDQDNAEQVLFQRPGLQNKLIRKLRRGQLRPAANLDLHGLTIDKAELALARFIQHCVLEQIRYALVIHGKGLRSEAGRAVLRPHVRHWLSGSLDVLAYCSAQPGDGGGGALYLLLKRSNQGG
ncbi:MAG: Smr/MutS family protein [Gammaproteobacteria bacterium]|nr:MAG: Smr/MutS family protein [Gammaproteobacteria bacterium]